MNIPIRIIQIKNGFEYKGNFEINGKIFDWRIRSKKGLDSQYQPNDNLSKLESMKQYYGIQVYNDGKEIIIDSPPTLIFLIVFIHTQVTNFYLSKEAIEFNAPDFFFIFTDEDGNKREIKRKGRVAVDCEFGRDIHIDVPDEQIPVQFK